MIAPEAGLQRLQDLVLYPMPMSPRSAARALPLLLLTVAACGGEEPGGSADDAPSATLPAFDTARIAIVTRSDTVPLTVELARTEAQRALGLMERAELAPGRGMLFLYPEDQPEDSGFWMFRTRIPLDVAFLDREGRILSIVPMEPCTSPYSQWCDTYPAGQPFAAGLEVARGFFALRGIGVGDRVLIPPTAAAGVR